MFLFSFIFLLDIVSVLVDNFFFSPVAIDVPHFGTKVGGRREVFVLSSNDGLKWHEHPSLSTEEFKESISPEGICGLISGWVFLKRCC